MFGDRPGRIAKLFERGQVGGEGGLGADLLGLGAFGHGTVVDTAGQSVQRGADRRTEDVGHFGVGQGRELAHRFHPEAVQLLLGHRADAPQPAHRQPLEQWAFLGKADHPDPVGFGQSRGDLGDLLARSGAHRGHQPGLGAHQSAQVGAEALDLGRIGAGQFHRLAECLVERKLFQHRQNRPNGIQYPPAGHPVDDTARRQHHRTRPDQAAGLMHRHGRARSVNPGLVAGAGHHAAAAETADQHRAAAQGRSGQLLDRREERVHVEVQDPAFHDCRC